MLIAYLSDDSGVGTFIALLFNLKSRFKFSHFVYHKIMGVLNRNRALSNMLLWILQHIGYSWEQFVVLFTLALWIRTSMQLFFIGSYKKKRRKKKRLLLQLINISPKFSKIESCMNAPLIDVNLDCTCPIWHQRFNLRLPFHRCRLIFNWAKK